MLVLSCMAFSAPVFAQTSNNSTVSQAETGQVIQDIRIDGLKRVSQSTVFNLLPLEINDSFDSKVASQTIRDLYKTGLFQQVDVFFDQNVVFIKLVENASIISIRFTGNKVFSDEVLTNVLNENGIAEGEIYQPSVGDKLIKELKRQYLNEGKYAADVKLDVIELDTSRVVLDLIVSEGKTARIEKISIVGNAFFSDKKILSEFKSKAGKRWNPFSKANRYSRSKVAADIEKMTSLYTDQGYADFRVTSSRVSINPKKDAVFLTLSVKEGPRYKVKQFSLNGRLTADESELLPLVAIRPQEFYSRKDVQTTVNNIVAFLADKGFSNARVVPVPSFDEKDKTVSFAINVNPAKTVFVRRIDFEGNTKTTDEVLRREMRQLEGAALSTSKVQESTRRIRRLRFIGSVDIKTNPVAEDENQVDILVTITETSSAAISFGAGVSGDDGLILQASYNESNFLGTGKTVDFKIDTSQSDKTLTFNYRDPYVTKSGVSRNIGLNFNRRDTEDNDTSEFLQDTLGLSLGYRFPLSSNTFFNLGATLEKIDLEATDGTSDANRAFITENPSNNILRINSRLGYDTRDSILAPTSGWNNFINLELTAPSSDLEYYKVDLNSDYYLPLTESFTFKFSGLFNYGDGFGDSDSLPFFRNYFAGGTTTVRGFEPRSLGPRENEDGTGEPIGGSKRVVFNTTLLTPIPGASANTGRIGFFIDAGQVFADDESIDLSELRTSAGISLNFLTPVGPLALSYAVPLDDKDGDETDSIQFTIGRFLD